MNHSDAREVAVSYIAPRASGKILDSVFATSTGSDRIRDRCLHLTLRVAVPKLVEKRFTAYNNMNVEQILRWIVVAIVLIVAVSLFSIILKIGAVLLNVALKILLILLLIAIILRFVGVAQRKRRY
jgi:hypothetical protein